MAPKETLTFGSMVTLVRKTLSSYIYLYMCVRVCIYIYIYIISAFNFEVN